jgi:hypothetical protein
VVSGGLCDLAGRVGAMETKRRMEEERGDSSLQITRAVERLEGVSAMVTNRLDRQQDAIEDTNRQLAAIMEILQAR